MNFPGDRDSRICANICCQCRCLVILTRCMTNLAPLLQVRRSDVMSSWSGIRHLATSPNVQGTDTALISRDHVVCLDLDG
jgi:glycerol-3-phosphate dehydrogenase